MTELYIDGYPVSLQEDLNIDFYVYNPFFSKKGEYTYDIDISLLDGNNAKIYGNIHRPHVDNNFALRQAILISDSKVLIVGSEIILSITDSIVKIQIVSGNSELNYLAAGNTKIRDLDLGHIEQLTNEMAIESLYKSFPQYNFVCTPLYYNLEQETTGSESATSVLYNLVKPKQAVVDEMENNTKLCPQPYMLYYIYKICESLGYSITENNLLNSTIYSKLIIVHGSDSLNYNEMIPNWDVDEFLSEFEKFCNVILVVNKSNKTIRILNVADFYNNSDKVYIKSEQIIGTPEKKYSQENELYLLYDNVKFELPNNDSYKYDSLSDDLISMCEEIHVSTYDDLYVNLYGTTDKSKWSGIDVSSKYNQLNIYVVDDIEQAFVLYKYQWGNNTQYNFRLVNRFKNVETDASSDTVSFKIIPADMAVKSWTIYDNNAGNYYAASIPIIKDASSTKEAISESNGLQEFILSGVPEESVPDKIFVTIYDGVKNMICWNGKKTNECDLPDYVYPLSYSAPYYSGRRDELPFYECQKVFLFGDKTKTLELKGKNGLFETNYNRNLSVDIKTEYIYKFISSEIFNAMEIYVIDYKMFYCKQLHYVIKSNRISKEVEATVYPI
ncbi:hypothetical protein [Phocaeicola paurosaccharolyticus]|uniref:hypothetical protein n=1 Tax=Phocaeicola paurosaccharolyticus TaxID=732242 RepID=UPI002FE3C5E5